MARKEAMMTWINVFAVADDRGVRAPAKVCLGGPLPVGQHFRPLTAVNDDVENSGYAFPDVTVVDA